MTKSLVNGNKFAMFLQFLLYFTFYKLTYTCVNNLPFPRESLKEM